MDRDETEKLLYLMKKFDNRAYDDDTVTAWQATLHDVSLRDAS